LVDERRDLDPLLSQRPDCPVLVRTLCVRRVQDAAAEEAALQAQAQQPLEAIAAEMGITVAQLLGQNDDPPVATAPVASGHQALTARDGADASAAGARGESDDADDSDADDSDDDSDGDASLSGEDEVDDEATLDEEAAMAAADGAAQVCAACCFVFGVFFIWCCWRARQVAKQSCHGRRS
jgi:hypothetical protein